MSRRMITTLEELEALAPLSVVWDGEFELWQKQGDGEGGHIWLCMDDPRPYEAKEIELPITLIGEAA